MSESVNRQILLKSYPIGEPRAAVLILGFWSAIPASILTIFALLAQPNFHSVFFALETIGYSFLISIFFKKAQTGIKFNVSIVPN